MIKQRRTTTIVLVGVIVVLCAFSLYSFTGTVTDRLDKAEAENVRQDRTVTQNERALTDANAKVRALSTQLEDLGKRPTVSSAPVLVDGKAGPGPTPGQLVVALQSFCISHGQCRGPSGLRGPPGKSIKGDTGDKGDTVIGPKGDSIKGDTGATGATGGDGKDGAAGKDGRGIKSTTCNADGTWTIAYDDGTAETTPGPCRVTTGPPAP